MQRLALVLASAVLAACSPATGHLRLGQAALARGELDEALVELRLAVAVAPRDAAARAQLGRALARAGLPGGALRELEAAWNLGDRSVGRELGALA